MCSSLCDCCGGNGSNPAAGQILLIVAIVFAVIGTCVLLGGPILLRGRPIIAKLPDETSDGGICCYTSRFHRWAQTYHLVNMSNELGSFLPLPLSFLKVWIVFTLWPARSHGGRRSLLCCTLLKWPRMDEVWRCSALSHVPGQIQLGYV